MYHKMDKSTRLQSSKGHVARSKYNHQQVPDQETQQEMDSNPPNLGQSRTLPFIGLAIAIHE
jgi:hypothetical protein